MAPPDHVHIPDLVGLTKLQAVTVLTPLGLDNHLATNPAAPPDNAVVVTQNPPEGTVVYTPIPRGYIVGAILVIPPRQM